MKSCPVVYLSVFSRSSTPSLWSTESAATFPVSPKPPQPAGTLEATVTQNIIIVIPAPERDMSESILDVTSAVPLRHQDPHRKTPCEHSSLVGFLSDLSLSRSWSEGECLPESLYKRMEMELDSYDIEMFLTTKPSLRLPILFLLLHPSVFFLVYLFVSVFVSVCLQPWYWSSIAVVVVVLAYAILVAIQAGCMMMRMTMMMNSLTTFFPLCTFLSRPNPFLTRFLSLIVMSFLSSFFSLFLLLFPSDSQMVLLASQFSIAFIVDLFFCFGLWARSSSPTLPSFLACSLSSFLLSFFVLLLPVP